MLNIFPVALLIFLEFRPKQFARNNHRSQVHRNKLLFLLPQLQRFCPSARLTPILRNSRRHRCRQPPPEFRLLSPALSRHLTFPRLASLCSRHRPFQLLLTFQFPLLLQLPLSLQLLPAIEFLSPLSGLPPAFRLLSPLRFFPSSVDFLPLPFVPAPHSTPRGTHQNSHRSKHNLDNFDRIHKNLFSNQNHHAPSVSPPSTPPSGAPSRPP